MTGGLGDERKQHIHAESFGMIADGADEVRRAVRLCCREGVDNVKINISGDEFVSNARAEITSMSEGEVKAAVETAHEWGKRVSAHARAAASVKRAVRNGVDCVYHCDFADEEALDMLESVKDKVFVGPAFGLVHNAVFEGDRVGMTRDAVEKMGLPRKLEACCRTYEQMRKRGMKVVVGGDYGFAITPMGQNARDIGHFVKFFGLYARGSAALRNLGRRRAYGPQGRTRCHQARRARRLGAGRRRSFGRSVRPGRTGPLRHDYEGRQDAPRSAGPSGRLPPEGGRVDRILLLGQLKPR